jgi:hypothetical protein
MNEMEWHGMELNWVEWNGIEVNGMESNEIKIIMNMKMTWNPLIA